MAITPKSFELNPRLTLMLAAAVGAVLMLSALAVSNNPELRCTMHLPADQNRWSATDFAQTASCLIDARAYDVAYENASRGLLHHPHSERLHNLQGYSAAEMGQHGLAAFHFAEGIRHTDSRTGLLENNLSWSMLWYVETLPRARRTQALLHARKLYETSLEKGSSCERIHTAMFVEYALTRDAQGDHDADAAMSVERYTRLRARYNGCETRIANGEPLVIEELAGAAVIDREMALLTRIEMDATLRIEHTLRAIQIHGHDMRGERMCQRAMPLPSLRATCQKMADSR